MMKQWMILLGLLCAASLAQAELYKWVDANGRVYYSDQPPPVDGKRLELSIQSKQNAQSSDNGKAPKDLADKEFEFKQRQLKQGEEQIQDEKKQAEAAKKEANCNRAKNNLKVLQESGRITRYNEKGEKVYVDDKTRQQEIEEAKQVADSWCN